MVIDAHTHAFPEAAQADPEGWAASNGEEHWLRLVLPGDGKPSLQGWAGQSDFLSAMDRDGVERCILLGWYWENPESCHLQNAQAASWIRDHPDRFSAFAAVHPDGGTPADWVRRSLAAGFLGFGELLPRVQGRPLSHPFWNELADRSAAAGLCFNFHVTEPVGRPHPGRVETPLAELQIFIERHPNLRIVLSHWGGGMFLGELNPFVRERFRNVWYDCSASPLLYDSAIFEIATRTVGAGKILFGSDFPLRLYPRRDRLPGWGRFLEAIEHTGLSHGDSQRILADNARRLFGLPPRPGGHLTS